MAKRCECPKPRRPPSRAQKAYAAARREAISSCLQRSPGPGRAPPLQLQPLKKAASPKRSSPVLKGIQRVASGKGFLSWFRGAGMTGGKEPTRDLVGEKYGYGSESYSSGKFSTTKG